jgi:hypothetical protein
MNAYHCIYCICCRLTSDETFLSFDGLESEGKSPELSGDVLRVLSIIEQWMQDCIDGHCSDDFIAQPILQKEIANLIQLLKQTKGFYAGTARNMKKLLDNIGKPHTSSFLSVNTERIPHHDHLYPVVNRVHFLFVVTVWTTSLVVRWYGIILSPFASAVYEGNWYCCVCELHVRRHCAKMTNLF